MQNMAFENVIILHYSFTTIFSCGTIFPSKYSFLFTSLLILFFYYTSNWILMRQTLNVRRQDTKLLCEDKP